MTNYKLVYFNGRGRAESIRYIFKLAGVKFEDQRFEMNEWPALKPTIPTFQLPMLEIDGKRILQSKSIIMHLARKYNLYGKDEFEGMCIDMIVDTADDVVPPWDLIFFSTTDEEKAKHTKNFQEVEIPLIYSRLERLRALEHMHAGDYFVGNKLTAADIHFISMVEVANVYFPDSLAKFPKLKAVFDRVTSNPIIAEWRKARPVTPW
ncbi:hematopoietic prostaglandin D synthase-like [Acanthaster planci]|uniref:glutathione transferase n=1 Tax=Acanthaster planci TaxID=133434 RepID=A0A8B7YJI5_ACAPL|nr:hematopoietic prostaglandin D synthase-like [Acanthaster planci]